MPLLPKLPDLFDHPLLWYRLISFRLAYFQIISMAYFSAAFAKATCFVHVYVKGIPRVSIVDKSNDVGLCHGYDSY